MTTEMCRQDDLIIATINASKLKSGEITEGEFYSETDTNPVVIFAFYQIENKELVEKQIEIIGEEINHNFNFFDCIDVNDDNMRGGELMVDAGKNDMTKFHKEVMKKFRPKVMSSEEVVKEQSNGTKGE